MSECSAATASGAVILEEPEVSGAPGVRREAQAQGPLRCGGCALWPRQQTWLCVVPLLIGFIGLGLSLMLLKWIVVGTVRDYVPTDLVDAKGIGQDPFSLSNPSDPPNNHQPDTTTTAGNPTSSTTTVGRVRTRATSTAARGGGASGTQVMPRNPTSHQSDAGGRGGGGGGARGPVVTTTTTAAPGGTSNVAASTSSPLPSNPTVLHDSTQMWTHEHTPTQRAVTTLAGRTHGHRKTPAPTAPPLRSEHFKPCHERDLAYCLNDGECFVIETLSGPHKHCRCREGYQGIRCDQFLPKTDSILSDPNHLGIEFMESKEVYKRQVLSITSIAVGISLLGMLCMALYCRNKRRREKLQAHLKETRSLKNYSANRPVLEPKTSLRPSPGLQLQNYCKRGPQTPEHAVSQSNFAQFNSTTPPNNSKCPSAGKHHRSVSLSHSPDQRCRATHWTVPRRTPPIPRSRLNPIGVSKHSGPAYQHLQEMESSEREVGPQTGCQGARAASDPRHDAFLRMQPPGLVERSAGWGSRVEVHCDIQEVTSSSTRSLKGPRRTSPSSPPPFRSCSIPIIPSVQAQQDEVSCMQTASGGPSSSTTCEPGPRTDGGEGFALISHDISNTTSCSYAVGQRDEVALLLEEAQEQLRALAHANRKHGDRKEDCGSALEAREIVCFLMPNGGAGGFSSNGPMETQLLSPEKPHRDTAQSGQ
ncbi:pro-neuregulin-3, membrane-bound isoform isoform X2 [Osmerus eperlanus]|uniref:pro-neuregulin-3, membrane-bound isoform isoform X2 n=1 Tax=Osmerus eperlanus TaxID=29151 RepID=UPI002E1175F3